VGFNCQNRPSHRATFKIFGTRSIVEAETVVSDVVMIVVATTDQVCRVVLNPTGIKVATADQTAITLHTQRPTYPHPQEHRDLELESHHHRPQLIITTTSPTTIDMAVLRATTNTEGHLNRPMVLLDTRDMVDNPMREDEAPEAMAQEVTIREVTIEMGGLTDKIACKMQNWHDGKEE
jgi:hypothetical protein